MACYMRSSKLVRLLSEVDARNDMNVSVLIPNQLALGADPSRPTHVIDFSKEKVEQYNPAELTRISERPCVPLPAVQQTPTPNVNVSKISRHTGDYWLEIEGRRTDCRSLKELLAEGLRTLEQIRPGTLEKLSNIKLRSRRIVARDRKQLFGKEHLTAKYSEQLVDGWWYGTNNSTDETNAWLERACTCSGLKWGADFKTNLTQSTRTVDDLDL